MSSTDFTPFSALFGGVFIGLGASVYLLVNGRIAGVSGLLGGLFDPFRRGNEQGALFLATLAAVGGVSAFVAPDAVGTSPLGTGALALAGLLVGVGTRMSGGCTSGHGLCGISRGSLRSIVATATFVATSIVTATLVHLLGGRS